MIESRKLQKQLENHKRLLKQMATTSCDCTLQFKISSNVDEMLNRIVENIKISCDTSSCNIAFKSVVEDNNVTEDECKDFDAYNEVRAAEIEKCEMKNNFLDEIWSDEFNDSGASDSNGLNTMDDFI